ncbi:MAG: cobalt-zinc-cadmium efflux system membrane fusion protein, partial [Myxococcota bacterium]
PEFYIGRLGELSGAAFELPHRDTSVVLTKESLLSRGTAVNPDTRTLSVRFRVGNSDRGLVAGMATEARLFTSAPRDVLAIPFSAVIDDDGVNIVYVQTGEEDFVRRPVRLGVRDGAQVEVLGGVAYDESVVSEGAYIVKLAALGGNDAPDHGHSH